MYNLIRLAQHLISGAASSPPSPSPVRYRFASGIRILVRVEVASDGAICNSRLILTRAVTRFARTRAPPVSRFEVGASAPAFSLLQSNLASLYLCTLCHTIIWLTASTEGHACGFHRICLQGFSLINVLPRRTDLSLYGARRHAAIACASSALPLPFCAALFRGRSSPPAVCSNCLWPRVGAGRSHEPSPLRSYFPSYAVFFWGGGLLDLSRSG